MNINDIKVPAGMKLVEKTNGLGWSDNNRRLYLIPDMGKGESGILIPVDVVQRTDDQWAKYRVIKDESDAPFSYSLLNSSKDYWNQTWSTKFIDYQA